MDLDKFVKEEDDKMKKLFGLESTIKQILYDAQVPDDQFNETFTEVVNLMKICVEREGTKKELYEIDLNNYKEDTEY